MIDALRKYGFYTMEDFFTMKREAEGYVSWGYKTGDGWLIGAEITGHILHDCRKVLAVPAIWLHAESHLRKRTLSFTSEEAAAGHDSEL